jgi:hypothetical protein
MPISSNSNSTHTVELCPWQLGRLKCSSQVLKDVPGIIKIDKRLAGHVENEQDV